MTDAAELSVVFKGREVGLRSLIAAIERELKQADAQTRASEQETEQLAQTQQKAASQALALASSYARLDVAQGNAANAASRLKTAIDQSSNASEKQIVAAQTQLARLEAQAAGTDRFSQSLAGLKDQAASVAGGMISLGAGIQIATQVAQSFADAFTFKAGLDATTTSINAQLVGVRDSGQVWKEAAAFADTYKLTQEEVTSAVQSGVGVMRASSSSTTDLLTTFQRLTVLAPDKPISEAARAIRELQSGDTTSIKELFNIAAKDANKMKAEIQGGADAVQVVAKYLDTAGVGMDALAAQTSGAAGRLRELAQAQEQLKLSQAEFAQGPGMALLQLQIEATRGGARLLSGDLATMGASLQALPNDPLANLIGGMLQGKAASDAFNASLVGGVNSQFSDQQQALAQSLLATGMSMDRVIAIVTPLAGALGEVSRAEGELVASGQASSAAADALGARLTALIAVGGPVGATASAIATGLADGTIQYGNAATAVGQLEQAQAQQASVAAQGVIITQANGAALAAQAQATGTATAAVSAQNQAIGQLLTQTTTTTSATTGLAQAQTQIAQFGGAVANGLITAANAAAVLANQYGITAAQADVLISAQARLAGQKAQTRDNSGSVGFNAPGRRGSSDNDILKTIEATQKGIADEAKASAAAQRAYGEEIGGSAVKIRNLRADLAKATTDSERFQIKTQLAQLTAPKGGGGGGGAAKAAKQEKDFQFKSEQQEQDHQRKLDSIVLDAEKKRAAASQAFQQSSLDGRAGFYARLADVEDAGTQRALSAKFEQASAKAQEIAKTTGPDAAQAYMDAATKAIEGQQSIQDKINEANKNKDKGKAEFLTGILELQKTADQSRIDQVIAAGSAISNEQATQWAAEETAYGVHLDKMVATFQQKTGGNLPGLAAPGPLGTVGSTAIPAGTPSPAVPSTGPQPSGGAQPVIDLATPAAVDQQTGQLLGALNAVVSGVADVASRVSNVERAIGSLKGSSAFAG